MENNVNNELNNNLPQYQNLNNNMPVQPSMQVPSGVASSNYQVPVSTVSENAYQTVNNTIEQTIVQSPINPVSTTLSESQSLQTPTAISVQSIAPQMVDGNNLNNEVGASIENNSTNYNHPIIEAPGMGVTPTVESLGAQPLVSDEKKKKSSKKILILLLAFIVIALVVVYLILFVFNKSDKKEDEPVDTQEPIVEENDWDPSTSKIIINSSATTLVCTSETEMNGMTNKITYTHIYEDDIYTQLVLEDEIIFTDDTIQYYNYYVGSIEEEIESLVQEYDNVIAEVREKKNSVSLAYSFDLTASIDNPKNMLEDKDVTMEDMKLYMSDIGFICE